MRTRIKICGVTTPEVARACIELGIDAIGLVFADSPRRIQPRAARHLIDSLPTFITTVGVFKGASPDAMRSAILDSGIAVAQAESRELAEPLPARTLPVFRTGADLSVASPAPLILIEGERSGAGITANWAAVEPIARRRNVVLAGGLNPGNVADAIRLVRPFAVDVSSGVERAPGVKDIDLILAFTRAVALADQSLYGAPA